MSIPDFTTPPFHIMVSSAIRGLEDERRAIKEELERQGTVRVELSEDWTSSSNSSEKLCLDLARNCDLFILLLGKHYGNPPKGYKISVTEAEFDTAREVDPYKIRAYLKPVHDVEPGQQRFIKKVRDFSSGLQCPKFGSIRDLKKYVRNDFTDYLLSRQQRATPLESTHTYPIVPKTFRLTKPFLVHDLSTIETVKPSSPLDLQRAHLKKTIPRETSANIAKILLGKMAATDRVALALISLGSVLARKEYLQQLFCDFKWPSIIRRLSEQGLITSESGFFKVPKNVRKQLNRDHALVHETRGKWIDILAQKSEYGDLALGLCLHLIDAKRFSEAVAYAHSTVLSMEDLFTTDLFLRLLTQLKSTKIYRSISNKDRILLLDAIGVCQTHDDQISDALETFAEMLRISRRAKNSWGIAQAFMHRGVAWSNIGIYRQAIYNYRQAVIIARRMKDEFLLGRALFNLSQSQLVEDPSLASRTLASSIRHKRRAGDSEGLFASYVGLGISAGLKGNHPSALRSFQLAERIAKRSRSLFAEANALHNQAFTLAKLGKLGDAIKISTHARRIAESLGRKSLIAMVTEGEATFRFQNKDYAFASQLFLKLSTLKKQLKDVDGAIVALSDAGVMAINIKRYDAAKKYLAEAISLSKSTPNRHWLMQCIKNYVEVLRIEGKHSRIAGFLNRERRYSERSGNGDLTTDISELLAQELALGKAPARLIDQMWMSAINSAHEEGNVVKQLELLRQRYAWIRDSQTPVEAAIALKAFLDFAKSRKKFRRDYVESLDEMGDCLQNQGQYDEAEKFYQKAMNLVQSDLDGIAPLSLLNNYAELLRKTERSPEAIPLYKTAIARFKSENDLDGQLSTEHNLALALESEGRTDDAQRIFRRILTLARNKRLWMEYVRARLALANSAWIQNKRIVALRRYGRVRRLCKLHDLRPIALQAALNESRLLQALGDIDGAVILLSSLRKNFRESECCLELFLELARCLIETKKYGEGLRVLEEGWRCPQARLSNSGLVQILNSLVDLNLRVGHTRKARALIERILAVQLNPSERAEQITELLVIVGKNEANRKGRGHQTEKLLREIQQYAKQDENMLWLFRAHERLAESVWDQNPELAVQAFIRGMVIALEEGAVEEFIKIGANLAGQLHKQVLSQGGESIKHLESKANFWLEQQLRKQLGRNSEASAHREANRMSTFQRLLWPFHLVEDLLRRPDKGRGMNRKEISTMIHKMLVG